MAAPVAIPAGAMLGAAAIGAVGSIAGGLIGRKGQKEALEYAKQQAQLRQQLVDAAGSAIDQSNINLNLRDYEVLGELTPEEYQLALLEDQGYYDHEGDLRSQEMMRSILEDTYRGTKLGMTPEMLAEAAQFQRQVDASSRGRLDALKQQFAARGMSGSGAEQLAQLQSLGDAAAQEAVAADNFRSQMAKQAMLNKDQAGRLAQQMDQRTYARDKESNLARQTMYEANQRNLQQKSMYDAAARSAAAEEMWRARNAANTRNITMSNEEKRRRMLEAPRQYWQDKMDIAKTKSGIVNQTSGQIMGGMQDKASADAQMWATGANTIGNLVGAMGKSGMFNSNPSPAGYTTYGNDSTKYYDYHGDT